MSGRRPVLGLLAVLAAFALAAVLVDRYVLAAEWWQVRRTETADPLARQLDSGPPPGPLAVSWERSTRVHRGPVAGYDGVAHLLADGQVVTASGRGLEVRDARTGDLRWSYRRAGWSLLGWAATGGRLAAYLERDGHRADRRLVAFDALSGALLWRASGERPAEGSRATLRWPAGSGTVLTTDGTRAVVFGRAAGDGARRWHLRVPAGCRLFEDAPAPADAEDGLAALALDCAGGGRLLALDPGTGRILWDRPLGSPLAPRVSVRGGLTLAADGTALRAFDTAGEPFAVWPGDEVCGDGMCPALAENGRLIVVYRPADAPPDAAVMESVDPVARRMLWRQDTPAYAALAAAGGRIYALRPRLAPGLLPAGVDLVSPADGAASTVPVPFALDPDLDGAVPWMAAAGGMLYVALPEAAPRPTGAAHLLVLRRGLTRSGPAELGGVPAARWPDACALLKPGDLTAARLPAYSVRAERSSVGPVTLPRPTACTYTPKQDERGAAGARAVRVAVRWVAPDGASAAQLMDALADVQSEARHRFDLGGDDVYELGPTAGTVAVRVDRTIVVVSASQLPGVAERLAAVLATRLPPAAPPPAVPPPS
ncbi:outer membrane protein assembly factor BamB family protein [Actinomadura parmotrematis]|uniref:PQQ-binding-like beta-propeller repeat protein n=1 Tax=Actinomadura parmotrematis TaxID=2864039 RepID=A0ABS7FW30_9ACTN|nr:PQQ-binding-like beta-propeller repeat protein [Actinomadura parmotrematis]MBW8484640.1 PQQ-binding-like beta-propeller repeat protein [Actinomadura parmotrematis]